MLPLSHNIIILFIHSCLPILSINLWYLALFALVCIPPSKHASSVNPLLSLSGLCDICDVPSRHVDAQAER